MNNDPHHELWFERWREDRIGFHQPDHNRHLVAHGRAVFGETQSGEVSRRVLVPLSGKSLDLFWLEDQGYDVTGVEYVPRAVEDFHRENDRPFERVRTGGIDTFVSGRITTALGDFFALEATTFGRFDAIYDRAALIAISPERRTEYVAKLCDLLSDTGSMLLVTVDYPVHEKEGPPHSVADDVVQELFADHFAIEQLHSEDILDRQEKWREDGVTRLLELVYKLDRR